MKAASIRKTVRITLLEDLQVGTGSGSAAIDTLQFRGADNRAAIPWTHLKGVWVDTTEQMAQRGAALAPGAREHLFGWDSQAAGRPVEGALRVGSAYLAGGGTVWVWEASAREPGSRRPKEDTLRSGEWVNAGSTFESQCELPASAEVDFELIVRATTRLGADRNRGALVRLDLLPAAPLVPPELCAPTPAGLTLRLLLEANEPLSFPDNPRAGNIVDGRNHAPGRALLGALVRRLHEGGHSGWAQRVLAGDGIAVGDGLPLPEAWRPQQDIAHLASLAVLPLPLDWRVRKSELQARSLAWPDWMKPSPAQASLRGLVSSLDEHAEHAEDKSKRLDAERFIARLAPGQPWLHHAPRMTEPLRIRVPRQRGGERGLFSSRFIAEGTRLLVDIDFSAPSDAEGFFSDAWPLLAQTPLLWLGRGARPVQLLRATWVARELTADALPDRPRRLTVLLASDTLLRRADLAFHTQADLTALELMLGAADRPPDVEVTAKETQTVDVRGFNAASGLPSATARALRRGTVLRVEGSGADLAEVARALRAGQATAERAHEGHGRLWLFDESCEPLALALPDEPAEGNESPRAPAEPSQAETDCHRAREFVRGQEGRFRAFHKSELQTLLQACAEDGSPDATRSLAAWDWLEPRFGRRGVSVEAQQALVPAAADARQWAYRLRWALAWWHGEPR